TLYLLGGDYHLDSPMAGLGSDDQTTHIRARGTDEVMITSAVDISQARNLSLSRIQFTSRLSISASTNVTVENCIFEGATSGIKLEAMHGIRIIHNEFIHSDSAAISFSSRPSTDIFITG